MTAPAFDTPDPYRAPGSVGMVLTLVIETGLNARTSVVMPFAPNDLPTDDQLQIFVDGLASLTGVVFGATLDQGAVSQRSFTPTP
jgi:hypothetical protein